MNECTIISKAALSRELKVSKARVSQLITAGLPVRQDGKIDREIALAWIKRYSRHPNGKARLNAGALAGAIQATSLNDDRNAKPSSSGAGAPVSHALNLSTMVASIAGEVGRVLLRHGIPRARALADEIGAEMVKQGALFCDDLVIEGDLPKPVGSATWAQHPWFVSTPLTDAEWQEIAEELDAVEGAD